MHALGAPEVLGTETQGALCRQKQRSCYLSTEAEEIKSLPVALSELRQAACGAYYKQAYCWTERVWLPNRSKSQNPKDVSRYIFLRTLARSELRNLKNQNDVF